MTENTRQYWKESIKGGIESYLNYMLDEFDVKEEDNKKVNIPCLCISEYPKSFQVILTFQFSLDDDIPLVYNQKILDYELPQKYSHGYTTDEMEVNNKIVGEIIKEINDEF